MLARYNEIILIPNESRTHDIWREMADICESFGDEAQEPIEKRQWYSAGTGALSSGLQETNFDVEKGDHLKLARLQVKYADTVDDLGIKSGCIKSSITTLRESSKLTTDGKRDLGKYFYKLSELSTVKTINLENIQQAIDVYEDLVKGHPENIHFKSRLAKYCHTKAMILNDNSEDELALHQMAIRLIKEIPTKDCSEASLDVLAVSYANAGMICVIQNIKSLAQDYFEAALDVYVSLKDPFDQEKFARLVDIYNELTEMTQLPYKKFFSYAESVFKGVHIDLVQDRFTNLHLAILNTSSSEPNFFHRSLIQFMRLIENTLKNPDFPNVSVKKWLEDKAALERFTIMRKEAEERCDPIKLTTMIEQSTSFPHAVALQLSSQEKAIKELKEGQRKVVAVQKELMEELARIRAENLRLRTENQRLRGATTAPTPASEPVESSSSTPRLFGSGSN